jgi:hypothetical protein
MQALTASSFLIRLFVGVLPTLSVGILQDASSTSDSPNAFESIVSMSGILYVSLHVQGCPLFSPESSTHCELAMAISARLYATNAHSHSCSHVRDKTLGTSTKAGCLFFRREQAGSRNLDKYS